MNKVMIVIFGMMIVTYIPRLLPLLTISGKKLPKRLERFLNYIPPTALGALIFPGVFSSIPENITATVVGIGVGCILAWYKGGIILPVAGSILSAFMVLLVSH